MLNPWQHERQFEAGTIIRAERMNDKLDGISSTLSEIAQLLNQRVITLPETFGGDVNVNISSVANSLLYFDADSNVSLYSLDTFDSAVTQTATARDQTLAARDESQQARTQASNFAAQASNSADAAAVSEGQASLHRADAETAASNAQGSANAAATSETNAAASETAAEEAKTNAAASKTAAATSATQSAQSASDALASKNAAETARTGAVTAETNAKTYRDQALTYRDEAETFRNQAQAAAGAVNYSWDSITGKPATATRWPTLNEIGLNNVDNTSDLDKPVSTATQAALDAQTHDYRDIDFVGNFNVDGSTGGAFDNGIYVSDSGAVVGSTNNPLYTAIISGQTANHRSIHLTVDSYGYLWGMRSHTNTGTYQFQSKVKHADTAGAVAWGNVSGKPDTATRWPTLSEIGAASSSHGHGEYVVKSSNATLNHLTLHQGATSTGDVLVQKDNPWLTLDSSSSGDTGGPQGAGISIGESGKKGAAAIHMTYIGSGKGYIGMGSVTDSIPEHWAVRFDYTNSAVYFRSNPSIAGNTNWHAGNLVLTTSAFDTAEGRIPVYRGIGGFFGLGSAAATDNDLSTANSLNNVSRLFVTTGSVPTDWPSAGFDTYPVGFNFFRSGIVRSQMAIGWSGSGAGTLAFRTADATGEFTKSWNKVWHNNNDGSGSGLDADLLDGLHASKFLRNDISQSINGNFTVKGNLSAQNDVYFESWRNAGEAGFYVAGNTGDGGRFLIAPRHSDDTNYRWSEEFGWSKNLGWYVESTLYVSNGLTAAGTGTIGGSNFNAGWLRVGSASNGIAFDSNEMYFTGEGNIGTFVGDLNLRPNGNIDISGRKLALGAQGRISGDSIGRAIIETQYGSLTIGPANTTYCHFYTGAGNFYFGTRIHVVDEVRVYNTNTYLKATSSRLAAGSTADIGVNTAQNDTAFELYQGTSTADAMHTYHIAGNYAVHFGLSNTRKRLMTGGWSDGNYAKDVLTRNFIYYTALSVARTLTYKETGNAAYIGLWDVRNGARLNIDGSSYQKGDIIELSIVNPAGTLEIVNLDGRIYYPDGTYVGANSPMSISVAGKLTLFCYDGYQFIASIG